MKTNLKYLLSIITVALSALCGHATGSLPEDTVYFYGTWNQMLDMEPMTTLLNPYVEIYTPFELFIGSNDERVNQTIRENGFVAVSLGDSIWFANSDYLQYEFTGDVSSFTNFVPVFFNERVAYLVYPSQLSVKEMLMGESESENIDYYYIDFKYKNVKKVTHNYLSKLLEDYHDLKVRYEGMKDYKKRNIIEYFFIEYVNRATQDYMRPSITEYIE